MTRTQHLGYLVLLAANQEEIFTGRVSMVFDFAGGSLKGSEVTAIQRKVNLQRLNESANKTLGPTETMAR